MVLVNLASFTVIGLCAEAGFRMFWNPKYWIRSERWLIGSGNTEAGHKWWPETTYRMESSEFRVRFRTNALGYRARPEPPRTARPYRIAFVGDSFTEGMQVSYDKTFCALIERGLAGSSTDREIVCENFGVAATGVFDYWHRITHDVLRPNAPDALILCLYPGNDFIDPIPADGFDDDGRPRREYFGKPSWVKHILTWLNLKSKFAHFIQRSLLVASTRWTPSKEPGPRLWWTDPEVASRGADAPAVRRSKALLRAIDEECRRHGTRLCIVVVGPVSVYAAKEGRSPIGQIVADWGIDARVIDIAIKALARPDHPRLLFPRDGHLNEAGHAFLAAEAIAPLRAALSLADR
jgi:hypothetical protein